MDILHIKKIGLPMKHMRIFHIHNLSIQKLQMSDTYTDIHVPHIWFKHRNMFHATNNHTPTTSPPPPEEASPTSIPSSPSPHLSPRPFHSQHQWNEWFSPFPTHHEVTPQLQQHQKLHHQQITILPIIIQYNPYLYLQYTNITQNPSFRVLKTKTSVHKELVV